MVECADVPIAIYTEQGLTLADNDDLKRVSRADGQWMLKGQTGLYESHKLKSLLATKHYADATRWTLWGCAVSVLCIALTYSVATWSVGNAFSVGLSLISVLLGMMPYLIPIVERYTRKKE